MLQRIDRPLVSIIVVSYNHANFIEDCLFSIFAQTYNNIEVIVVDNCSQDGSQNILKKYDGRIRLVLLPDNKGVTGAINIGMQFVLGKYVTFFASDDLMLSNRISVQVDFLEHNAQVAGCFGNMLRIDKRGELHPRGLLSTVGHKQWTLNEILFSRIKLYSPTQLYRAEVIKEIGQFDETVKIEDIWLYIKILSAGYKLYSLPFLFTLYRIHSNNTHSKTKLMMAEKIKILSAYKSERFYKKALRFVYLESFSNFGSTNKVEALKLLPVVFFSLNSRYLYFGLLRLLLDWRFVRKIFKTAEVF